MRKKIIQLPKPHLSYSQIQLWKHDKARYRKLYYENRDEFRLHNSGLEYGKMFAEAIENEKETGDLMTDSAILILKKYDIRDKEILVEIKTKEGSFNVLGRPDTMDSATKAFREYKSGKGKWTQNKAQKHPQMVFYAMLIYLKYGVVLTEAWLDWVETMDVIENEGTPAERKVTKPTGRVESFYVTFTLLDILNCISDTIKIAKEIELDFACYVPEPEPVF